MYEVIQSDSVTPQLMEFLEERQVDSNDLVSGDYQPARVNIPDADDIGDRQVKAADTNEDTANEAVEVKTGTAVAGEESGWYEVTFEEPFGGNLARPIVNATATRRTGEFGTGEFQPPGLEVGTIDFLGISQIEAAEIAAGRVEGRSISLDEIAVGRIEVGGVQIGDLTIPAPEIRERNLSHEADISGADVSLQSPTLNKDIGVSDFGVDIGADITQFDAMEDFAFPSPDVLGIKSQFREIQNFSFQSLLVETTTDTGEELYIAGEDAFQNIPVQEVRNPLIDAWDTILKETYGYGDGRAYDAGWVEQFWSAVGAELDQALDNEFGDRILDQEDVVDRVDSAFNELQSNIQNVFLDFRDDLQTKVGGRLDEVGEGLDLTQTELDNSVTQLVNETNRMSDDMQADIEESLVSLTDNIQSEVDRFVNEDLQDSLVSIDEALVGTEAEINSLSSEVSEQMQLMNEDTNTALRDLTEITQQEFNSSIAETQSQINSSIDDIEVSVNERLISMQNQTNNSIIDIQESSNSAIADLEAEINTALEDIQIDTNDSIADIEQGINDKLETIDQNFADLDSRINNALAEITAQAEAALNESLELLYSTMGMPKGELMVPVQIRNVSNEGFEFLGYQGGTEINWTAMGRTGSQIDLGSPVSGGGTDGGGSSDGDSGGDSGGDQENIGPIVDAVIERLEERGVIDGSISGVGARR